MNNKTASRFFNVEYMTQGGGQVFSVLVEYYELSATGKQLTDDGFCILSCKECA